MGNDIATQLQNIFSGIDQAVEKTGYQFMAKETGTITYVGDGIAKVDGLPGIKNNEIIQFTENTFGAAFSLGEDEISVMLFGEDDDIQAGKRVRRTGEVLKVPAGEELFGRIVDPLGRPIDEAGPVESGESREIYQPAPAIMDRAPVDTPLQTGIKAVDALIPIGRGQRELILGDRQTGKTGIAVDTIINQADTDVISIYCAVGKRSSAIAKAVDAVRTNGNMDRTIIVAATEEDPPGINYIAPYTAAAMGEYFMYGGEDVLVIFDDLTRHARSYRELSLLLRRPPAREAYPGDIFYIHSSLLERATHLLDSFGGGSMTALPIIETQAQNISAYIPTNLISITDGQIYLSPDLFQKGVLPPVDVGKSVSRVGGKAQLPVFRNVSGNLRLSYSQFEELENFSRFGVRLDEETRRKLERGRRVREILGQKQYQPLTVPEQIAQLFAVTGGLLDNVAIDEMESAKEKLSRAAREELSGIADNMVRGKELREEERQELHTVFSRVLMEDES